MLIPLLRTQWKKCTFSGDGEFIVAGSHRQHALYIWDKATGSLVKMLTGQKGETLLDIAVCDKIHCTTAVGLLVVVVVVVGGGEGLVCGVVRLCSKTPSNVFQP